MIKAMFDDHYESFSTWREAGLKELCCLHIDAHLDLMEDDFEPDCLAAISQAKNAEELEKFRSLGGPWGGSFHCGNFLYPALRDGTISELIWILPPHILQGTSRLDATLEELRKWVDLPLADYANFQERENRVEGTLLGVPFVACTSQNLPTLSPEQKQRLAIDIDVDYFIRVSDNKLWETPEQLAEALGPLEPLVLTVALSRDGGYTPPQDQYLGKVCLDVFSGQSKDWGQKVRDIQKADELPEVEREKAWESLLTQACSTTTPALLARLGRWEQAHNHNSLYQNLPLNQAARLMEQKNWGKSLDFSSVSISSLEKESLQVRFFSYFFSNQFREALEISKKLREIPDMARHERIKILQLSGEAHDALQEYQAACALYRHGLLLSPSHAGLHLSLALSQKQNGEKKKATRALRKSLRFSEGKLSHLSNLILAINWYEELGQKSLAQAARRELQAKDPKGSHVLTARLKTMTQGQLGKRI